MMVTIPAMTRITAMSHKMNVTAVYFLPHARSAR